VVEGIIGELVEPTGIKDFGGEGVLLFLDGEVFLSNRGEGSLILLMISIDVVNGSGGVEEYFCEEIQIAGWFVGPFPTSSFQWKGSHVGVWGQTLVVSGKKRELL